jgi:hypothetical protein
VIRKPVPLAKLRAELNRLLPFTTTIAICHGVNVTALVDSKRVSAKAPAGVVRFVSVLPNKTFRIAPMRLPSSGRWLVRVVAQQGRFVLGEYRRHMKTIGYLGQLDKLIGAPVTTRNWNTILLIAKALRS